MGAKQPKSKKAKNGLQPRPMGPVVLMFQPTRFERVANADLKKWEDDMLTYFGSGTLESARKARTFSPHLGSDNPESYSWCGEGKTDDCDYEPWCE